MAQAAYATLQQVKDQLRIATADQDSYLNDLLTRSQAFVDGFTRRKFGATTGVDFQVVNEVHDSRAANVCYLDNMDIQSIQTFQIGNVTGGFSVLAPSSFLWKKNGRIVIGGVAFGNSFYSSSLYPSLSAGYQTIQVSYTFGYIGVPLEITQATVDIASQLYALSKAFGVRGEKIGEYQIQYDINYLAQLENRPDILGTLKAWRRPIIGSRT